MIGIGVDLVEVDRMRTVLARTPTMVDRLFTAGEQAYARAASDPSERFAARFAAKEAAMKALGTGFVPGVGWHDFEVLPEPSGAPKLTLSGGAAEKARSLGIGAILVTMSHCRTYATATAIAVGGTT